MAGSHERERELKSKNNQLKEQPPHGGKINSPEHQQSECDEEFLAGLPPQVVEQYKKFKAAQDKLLRAAKEKFDDLTIKAVGFVFVGENLKGETDPQLILERVKGLKQLWKFRDKKGEEFYLIDPKNLSPFDRAAIRDRIVEQRTAWNALPRERQAQIEKDFDPTGETPASARPYQDFLRSQALERIFIQAKKSK